MHPALSYLVASTNGFATHLLDNKTHIDLTPLIAQVATVQSPEYWLNTHNHKAKQPPFLYAGYSNYDK